MTPEKLIELIDNPKVAAKLADLLDDPRLKERVADLLNEPAVAHNLSTLLQRPEVHAAVERYVHLAMVGVGVLAVLVALNLVAALYNGLLLRRLLRDTER